MRNTVNILHLSDFHISSQNKDKFSALCENINDALKDKEIDNYPQVVLVTGDFTEEGNADQFKWFKEGFKGMLSLAYFSHVEHVMVLAGNHDYSWAVKETRQDDYLRLCSEIEKGVEKIDEDDANKTNIKYVSVEQRKKTVLIVGLDSMKIDSPEWPGIGYFTKEQLRKFSDFVQKFKGNNRKQVQIFVAFHHHLVPVSALERDTLANPQKFSLTLDARRAIDEFIDNGVEFAIHGHQHQPSMITWRNDDKKDKKDLHIISAGCLAGKLYAGDVARNSFMLYSVGDNRVTVNQATTSPFDEDKFVWNAFEYFDENKESFICSHLHSKQDALDNSSCTDNSLNDYNKGVVDRKRILALAEQDDRWINKADQVGPLTIKGLVEKLVDSIADDGSVAYEVDTQKRYRTSTLATVLECMDDIDLLPKEDLLIMQRKLFSLKEHFEPIEESDDIITKKEEDKPAWGIDEAPSVWTTSKALVALFKTGFIPASKEEEKSIKESVLWLANQAYSNGGWGYQKEENIVSCRDNVPMTALAMKALSLSLLDPYISPNIDSNKVINALEAGLDYLRKKKKEKDVCYWSYEDSPNLSASIWALEAWNLACKVINKKKYYIKIYVQIKPKVLKYVIEKMPEKEDDEKWTECFFRAKIEDGLKYKPAPLKKEKAFYSFTPYLISYYIKEDVKYVSDPKVLSVIKWVLAHRGDSWLIQHNYNSKNACTISVAMAINVIVNWFKTKANILIEQETESLFEDNTDV